MKTLAVYDISHNKNTSELIKLFEPVRIGTLEVKNRIVMPAMGTKLQGLAGEVNEHVIDYYAERARGGVGLIIVEGSCVESNLGKTSPISQNIDHDKFLPNLNELAETVQAYGAKTAIQLFHAGRLSRFAAMESRTPVSCSEVPTASLGIKARALTSEEIRDLVEAFAEGVRRAKKAGFEAVEIHGAHGYLVAQFLSPYTNKRTDEYGGDIERRMRFALEIIKRSREQVGSNYPIIFRMSGDEHVYNGLRIKETQAIAKKLEEEGVDSLHISAGIANVADSRHWVIPPMAIPRGCNVHLAEKIKAVVDIPVITVGRINDPLLAESILQENKADLVSMGRALIADPELPIKAAEGRFGDITRCIACNRGCIGRVLKGFHIGCDVNATVGREKLYRIVSTNKPKKVIVVGGGPAGMKAAMVSALIGHDVVLYDKNSELGGQLLLAAKPPHKEEIMDLAKYLVNQIGRLGINVKLGVEATVETVKEMEPDAVIVATGSIPLVPDLPGIHGRNVVTAREILAERAIVGEHVVVAGGGTVGCETAEFLAESGKNVTVVEMLGGIAMDMEKLSRIILLERFAELGIKYFTNTRVKEITDIGLVAVSEGLKEITIKADTVVLALGSKANRKLAKGLEGIVKKLYMVGDCFEPRKIGEAIHEGFQAALNI